MWINAVVLGLGHGAHALVVDRRAHRQAAHGVLELGADDLAAFIKHMLDVVRPEVLLAALLAFARVDVIEHHALREQAGEGFVDFYQPQVAHHLGPETCIQQVQNGVLDAADVLVHGHPILGPIGHHLLVIVGVAVAHEIP